MAFKYKLLVAALAVGILTSAEIATAAVVDSVDVWVRLNVPSINGQYLNFKLTGSNSCRFSWSTNASNQFNAFDVFDYNYGGGGCPGGNNSGDNAHSAISDALTVGTWYKITITEDDTAGYAIYINDVQYGTTIPYTIARDLSAYEFHNNLGVVSDLTACAGSNEGGMAYTDISCSLTDPNAGGGGGGGGTSTFTSYLTNVQAVIASTTGFSMAAVAIWAGDNLIKLFIGSGVAVLYELRYWLVAMMIIGAIILFAYRAFRFFRH